MKYNTDTSNLKFEIQNDVDNKNFELIEAVLFKKKSRPPALVEQIFLLKTIRDTLNIPVPYELNAAVAYSYKLMESNSSVCLLEEASAKIKSLQTKISALSENKNFRFSQTHLFTSSNYCLLQILIHLERRDDFFDHLGKLRDNLITLDFSLQLESYYSTHANVVRVIGLHLCYCIFYEKDESLISENINFIIRSTKCSSKYISMNNLRFLEYIRTAAVTYQLFEFNQHRSSLVSEKIDSLLDNLLHVNKNKTVMVDRLRAFLKKL